MAVVATPSEFRGYLDELSAAWEAMIPRINGSISVLRVQDPHFGTREAYNRRYSRAYQRYVDWYREVMSAYPASMMWGSVGDVGNMYARSLATLRQEYKDLTGLFPTPAPPWTPSAEGEGSVTNITTALKWGAAIVGGLFLLNVLKGVRS